MWRSPIAKIPDPGHQAVPEGVQSLPYESKVASFARRHLSRLRGRSTRSQERGGRGTLYPLGVRYVAGPPPPTPPRKREREFTVLVCSAIHQTIKGNLMTLPTRNHSTRL